MLTAVITSPCTHSNATNKSANQLVAQCSLAANQTHVDKLVMLGLVLLRS